MTILIVGLGNPGPQYESTRHNAGVMVIDELLTRVLPMPAQLSAHKKTNTEIAELAAGRLVANDQVVLARTRSVSYTHLTLPTNSVWCRSRGSPDH